MHGVLLSVLDTVKKGLNNFRRIPLYPVAVLLSLSLTAYIYTSACCIIYKYNTYTTQNKVTRL